MSLQHISRSLMHGAATTVALISGLAAGRNIHALDPYRMPSLAAEERGYQAAAAILESHQAANAGAYPETVAVNLWGLDAIKTKGESVAMAIWLVGARPVKEGTGRIARFELLSLEELGRPRIDVLCNMSGIFRCALHPYGVRAAQSH